MNSSMMLLDTLVLSSSISAGLEGFSSQCCIRLDLEAIKSPYRSMSGGAFVAVIVKQWHHVTVVSHSSARDHARIRHRLQTWQKRTGPGLLVLTRLGRLGRSGILLI